VNVLLSLDPSKLDYDIHACIARTMTSRCGSKMYCKAASSIRRWGIRRSPGKDPDIRNDVLRAIKWSLGMTDGSTASHPAPGEVMGLSVGECRRRLVEVAGAVIRRRRDEPMSAGNFDERADDTNEGLAWS